MFTMGNINLLQFYACPSWLKATARPHGNDSYSTGPLRTYFGKCCQYTMFSSKPEGADISTIHPFGYLFFEFTLNAEIAFGHRFHHKRCRLKL